MQVPRPKSPLLHGQRLTKDPRFSKLDLISCRNVLLYFGKELHAKAISIFHDALKPTGLLLLGISESIGLCSALFHTIDCTHNIYATQGNTTLAEPPSVEMAGGLHGG